MLFKSNASFYEISHCLGQLYSEIRKMVDFTEDLYSKKELPGEFRGVKNIPRDSPFPGEEKKSGECPALQFNFGIWNAENVSNQWP